MLSRTVADISRGLNNNTMTLSDATSMGGTLSLEKDRAPGRCFGRLRAGALSARLALES